MAVGGIPQRSWPDRSWPDRSIPYAPTGGGGGESGQRESMIAILISMIFGGNKWV